MRSTLLTSSAEETFAAGARFAGALKGTEILAFFGDLGSGKTTFLKGVITALTECTPEEITSPTFTYLHIYNGSFPVYHFDLYRLSRAEEFEKAGFSEYLQGGGICCIEWAERIVKQLPSRAILITIEHQQSQHQRRITIQT